MSSCNSLSKEQLKLGNSYYQGQLLMLHESHPLGCLQKAPGYIQLKHQSATVENVSMIIKIEMEMNQDLSLQVF